MGIRFYKAKINEVQKRNILLYSIHVDYQLCTYSTYLIPYLFTKRYGIYNCITIPIDYFNSINKFKKSFLASKDVQAVITGGYWLKQLIANRLGSY